MNATALPDSADKAHQQRNELKMILQFKAINLLIDINK